MYEGKTVAAVVPAYNEEEFVGEVIRTLPWFVDRAYVVDDASTDDTWEEIRRQAERVDNRAASGRTTDGGREPGVRVEPIRHEENRGVGAAIKTGYRHALADGMDVTTVIAGDGQMEGDAVERVVAPVARGKADYAKGNRLVSDHRQEMPSFRQLGNFLLTGLTKVASGYWRVMDPQNGCTAISLDALEGVDLDELYDEYGFANDLLVRLNAEGFVVADVPQRAIYDDEESHIEYRTFVPRLSALLLRDFVWRLRENYLDRGPHPIVTLYTVGAAALGGALLWVARGVVRRGNDDRGVAVAPMMLGLVAVVIAMTLDDRENRHLQIRPSEPTEHGSEGGNSR